MSIEEVRGAFLGFYEKRLRLRLLDAELIALQDSAQTGYVSRPDDIESKYSLVTFDIATIQSVVADTYPITAGHTELLAALHQLRQAVSAANNRARVFFSTAGLSFSNERQRLREHNEHMEEACERIKKLAAKARSLLRPVIEP